jgi:hypothetical protein
MITDDYVEIILIRNIYKNGGVLAKHHKMCKFANWSRQSNNTFCSSAPGHATEEQAKQPNIHMRGESST